MSARADPAAPVDLERILREVKGSRKYRHLCDETVRRIASSAARRSSSHRDAVKRTKRKLHQACGAYLAGWDARRAERILDALPAGAGPQVLRSACRQLMAAHASTKERLGMLERLYAAIFEVTGTPASVLDLGCGLHPLALPWMQLPPATRYTAWEIDERIVALVNRFFELAGRKSAVCLCKDLLAQMPTETADIAFLLKVLPGLERQQAGSGLRLLGDLPARFVVVSFPVRSLSGRDRNMPENYAAAMETTLSQLSLPARRIDCDAELVFVVDKARGRDEGTGLRRT